MASQKATASWNMDDLVQQRDDYKTRVAELETTVLSDEEKCGTLLKVSKNIILIKYTSMIAYVFKLRVHLISKRKYFIVK